MTHIAAIIHGPYAYLLVFQILLVSILSLIALSLLVKRVKIAATGAELNGRMGIEEVRGLETQVSSLIAERNALKTSLEEAVNANKGEGHEEGSDKLKEINRGMAEKVKYLESKLLEYEILQEEIGNLSALKVDNEKMKTEILELNKQLSRTSEHTESKAPDTHSTESQPKI